MDAPADSSASAKELTRLRKLAESAARIGGNLALRSFGARQEVRIKRDHSEVTDVDIAVEQTLIEHIHARRPDDPFIGEESTAGLAADGRQLGASGPQSPISNRQSSIGGSKSTVWIIDPIDGTRNYVRGLRIFVCSVAAMRQGMPIAGAVYDPVQRVMYSAAAGQGVLVNGQHLPPSDAVAMGGVGVSPVAGAIRQRQLLVGIPSAGRPATRKLVQRAVDGHVVRNLGSAALHLVLVATGRLDVAIISNSRLWDIAAGGLLIIEAGGVVTSPDGAPLFPLNVSRCANREIPLLAGNVAAHARLMREARRSR